eukprot:GDKK01022898.1.p1 GENE.GDKK01022898.1~~GDKK01022898.1.p1  ORF type:complete len:124 (-),score=19.51 GDKK01022898.1:175-546(-)
MHGDSGLVSIVLPDFHPSLKGHAAIPRLGQVLEPQRTGAHALLLRVELLHLLVESHLPVSLRIPLDVGLRLVLGLVVFLRVRAEELDGHEELQAAMTVLKVDQIVMSKPAGGPKPKKGPQDED